MFTYRKPLYLGIVLLLAHLLVVLSHNSHISVWLIPVIFTFALTTEGRTLIRREFYLAAMGALLLLAIFISSLLAAKPVILLLWFVLMLMLYYYYRQRFSINARTLILFVVMTFVFAFNQGSIGVTSSGYLTVLIGVLGAMVAQYCCWPILMADAVVGAKKNTIRHLGGVNQAFFACLLQENYAENTYYFEFVLHQQKRRYFASLTLLQQLKDDAHAVWCKYVGENELRLIARLYESMMDYMQIRWRIEDHHIYSLCHSELQRIGLALNGLIASCCRSSDQKRLLGDAKKLEQALNDIEIMYHQVLSVSVNDPMAILLFIRSLRYSQQVLLELKT